MRLVSLLIDGVIFCWVGYSSFGILLVGLVKFGTRYSGLVLKIVILCK